MKKPLLTAFLLLNFSFSLAALDLVFKLEPSLLFPVDKNIKMAPGGIAQANVDLFNFFTPGLEGGYFWERPAGGSEGMNVIFGGINLGAYYYPLSRLYVGGGFSFGADSSASSNKELTKSQPCRNKG